MAALAVIAVLSSFPEQALAVGTSKSVAIGRFYTEAGGGTGLGYLIADGKAGRFGSSYQALGGVAALGYPASQPYRDGGFTYQATQGALLQWRPELDRAILANVFEQLSDSGVDDELYTRYQVPRPIRDDGSGGDFQKAVQIRLDWLTDPIIARKFMANPNPAQFRTWTLHDAIQLYGLPMSKPQTFGPFVSQRFQRITFQHWVKAVDGMPTPGSVVRVLGGDLAKKLGLVPDRAQMAQLAPGFDVADATWPSPVFAGRFQQDDLLANVPVVDEHALNHAACGVSATTMVVDYYMGSRGLWRRLPDIRAVSAFVKIWYHVHGGVRVPGGTSFSQLQTGVQDAGKAFKLPLAASWATTTGPDTWLSDIQRELDHGHPIIVFLTDGGPLWQGRWHYGHYVVVSGHTATGWLIYHDPWDGKAHALPAREFGAVWGGPWHDNPTWQYLRILPGVTEAAR